MTPSIIEVEKQDEYFRGLDVYTGNPTTLENSFKTGQKFYEDMIIDNF